MNFLIVDDESLITKTFALNIKKHIPFGSNIKTCYNGNQVIELITKDAYNPHIVLMDFNMPGLNGLETAKFIKEWNQQNGTYSYIIMVTSERHLENNCLEIADDFISKPVDIQLLLSRVHVGIRTVELILEKDSLIQQNSLITQNLQQLNSKNHKLVNNMSNIIDQIVISLSETAEYKDHSRGSHTFRVGFISDLLANEMNIKETDHYRHAGFLHDVGKIGIPDAILNKPGRLTAQEFKTIQNHPQIGVEILKPINFFDEALKGVHFHHERWDGEGYPHQLKKEEIPLIARVVSVADVFDVLMSKRPYKTEKLNLEEAQNEIIRHSNQQFDPDVVAAFRKIYKRGEIKALYENKKNFYHPNNPFIKA